MHVGWFIQNGLGGSPDSNLQEKGVHEHRQGSQEQTHDPEHNFNTLITILTGSNIVGAAVVFILCAGALPHPNRTLNQFRQTKTLHYSHEKALQWTSLMSTVPYLEGDISNDEPISVQRYGVFDVTVTDDDNENTIDTQTQWMDFKFMINGESLGLLTSIGPANYMSAVLLTFFMYSLHVLTTLDQNSSWNIMKKIRKLIHRWKSHVFALVILIWFFVYCNILIFKKWQDFEWTASDQKTKLSFRYYVEGSYISAFYAGIVISVYAFYLCVETKPLDYEQATDIKPYNIEYCFLGAIAFLLLTCTIIGLSSSVILETEAQVLIACALAMGLIEYFSTVVIRYIGYVQEVYVWTDIITSLPNTTDSMASHLNLGAFEKTEWGQKVKDERELQRIQMLKWKQRAKENKFKDIGNTIASKINDDQGVFMFHLMTFVQVLCILTNLLVAIPYMSIVWRLSVKQPNAFVIELLIFGILYGFSKVYYVVTMNQQVKHKHMSEVEVHQTGHVHFSENNVQYVKLFFSWSSSSEKHVRQILTTSMIFIVIITAAGYALETEKSATKLSKHEKIQYISLEQSMPNSNCSGIQSNQLIADVLDNLCEKENKMFTFDLSHKFSPIDLKVYAWTCWWQALMYPVFPQLPEKDPKYQHTDTFFCSTGFEFNFGDCRREYARKNNLDQYLGARMLPDSWQQVTSSSYKVN